MANLTWQVNLVSFSLVDKEHWLLLIKVDAVLLLEVLCDCDSCAISLGHGDFRRRFVDHSVNLVASGVVLG